MSHYVWQKVVRRKLFAFRPAPKKAPDYIITTAKEVLECGHEIEVFPSEIETLTARKRSCHQCSGWFGGLKLPELKKPVQAVKKALNRAEGEGYWVTVCVAFTAAVLLILWIAGTTRTIHFYSYPDNYLRVIKNLDPCLDDGSCGYRFVVQSVVNGVPNPETEMHFCRNLQPRFEAGHILAWIRYTDMGTCQAIDGYDVLHGDNSAVTAPNCNPDYSTAKVAGHLVCAGGKAKF